jgi:flagellar basal-body rod protein FlgB
MDLNKITLFQMISKRMDYLNERQKVLAQNVANSDTPQYRPSDLKPQDFRAELGQAMGKLAPTATSPMHFAGASSSATAKTEPVKLNHERSISGNGVDLEQELMKVAETATDFQTVTNLMRKQVAMIKTALGRQS